MNTLLITTITHTGDWICLDMSEYKYHATMTIPANEKNGKEAYNTIQIAVVINDELRVFDVDMEFDEVTKFVKEMRK